MAEEQPKEVSPHEKRIEELEEARSDNRFFAFIGYAFSIIGVEVTTMTGAYLLKDVVAAHDQNRLLLPAAPIIGTATAAGIALGSLAFGRYKADQSSNYTQEILRLESDQVLEQSAQLAPTSDNIPPLDSQ